MAENKDFDGLIGTGSGLINPNSEDFKALKEAIKEHSSQTSLEEKIRIKIKGLQYRMESYLSDDQPVELISVGSFLKELVEAIGVSHKDFAAYIGFRSSNLSALYNGSRRFNHDLALKLGQIFGINPALWLTVQNKIELFEIQQKNHEFYEKYQLDDLLKRAG